MKQKNYLLVKNNNNKEIVYIDYNKLDGFKIKPQNNVKYDGILVNKMIIIKPSFIEKTLKRKIKKKLDTYLQYIISVIESSDDTDASNLAIVLNDVERYRRLLRNKYRRYLDDKYFELLLKKIALLEQELKSKVLAASYNNYEYLEQEEKSRKSR
jgi:hypothetical protein